MGSEYKGSLDCLTTTYNTGGLRALYRGLPSPLLGSMAECSTLFVAYGAMKNWLNVNEDTATLANPVPMWKYCIAGAWSGLFSSFVLTPVELVKCRMQVLSGTSASFGGQPAARYAGPLDCAVRIVRQEGIQGLWRGNLGCLAREIPGNLAWFGAYELALRGIQVARHHERKADVPLAFSALAGSVAGVAYWAVPFPADTVKSKLQTDPRFEGRPFVEVFRQVLREDGVAGLYRGAGITCARAAPAHALLFFAYEVASSQLKRL